jgi:putative holliday junction resolvase
MDGSEGSSAVKVRAFAESLGKRLPATRLVFVDETLTTATAADKLREAGRSAKQQKAIIDQAAAVEILNLWMAEG